MLKKVGGDEFIIELAESVPIAENAPYYAQEVRDAALRRQVVAAAGSTLKDAYESTDKPADLIDRAEQRVFRIAQGRSTSEPRSAGVVIQDAYQSLDRMHEQGVSMLGLATGFIDLDDILSGLQESEMYVLAARPSMGKTALALALLESITFNMRQPAALFSLEMSQEMIGTRILGGRGRVDSHRMKRNMLNADEFRRLQEVYSESQEAPLYIDDTPALSVVELRSKCRRLVDRFGLKAVFVDYLQLMRSPGAESRQQEVAEISRSLKALARELSVPVVALSQLNRNVEGRKDNKPMLSDLRESGAIEQDADVVLLLHREEYYHQDPNWRIDNPDKIGLAEVFIAKHRNGKTGTVELHFQSEFSRFDNRASAHAQATFI